MLRRTAVLLCYFVATSRTIPCAVRARPNFKHQELGKKNARLRFPQHESDKATTGNNFFGLHLGLAFPPAPWNAMCAVQLYGDPSRADSLSHHLDSFRRRQVLSSRNSHAIFAVMTGSGVTRNAFSATSDRSDWWTQRRNLSSHSDNRVD